MIAPFAAACLVVHVVVDQIDAGVAAVELRGAEIVWLPVDVLPAGTSEGDRLVVRVRCRPTRRARAARFVPRVDQPDRPELPHPTGPRPEEKSDVQEDRP